MQRTHYMSNQAHNNRHNNKTRPPVHTTDGLVALNIYICSFGPAAVYQSTNAFITGTAAPSTFAAIDLRDG